jgi:protein SCO1/2
MKNHVCVAILVIIFILNCAGQGTRCAEPPSCCQKDLAKSPALTDRSIYQVDSAWTNDLAKAVRLTDLRAKPQVLTMFFSHCQSACPLLVEEMKKIESALPVNVRSRVGFVLVSFDTERDTPEVLAGYREQHSLDPARWTLLRGKSDDVLELAALLGVSFKKDAAGQFAHSNVITLLNAQGEIVKQQIGFGEGGKELVKSVEQMSLADLATPRPSQN